MTARLRRPRRHTRPIRLSATTTRTTVQRCCNGCGRRLGDVTDRELELGVVGMELPDARPECPTCTPNPPGLVWTLDLPWTSPPLSMNQRHNRHAHARLVKDVRNIGRLGALRLRLPPMHRLAAELHYAPRDERTRDPINLTPTLKALEDGLVDANVVPDDNRRYVESPMPVIDPSGRGAPGRLYLLVREIPPTQEGNP